MQLTVRSVGKNCPLYKSRGHFSYLKISFTAVAPYNFILLSNICVWFPVVSAATSNGTHEMLIVSDCGEKYTDVSLLGTKMEHLNEVGSCSMFVFLDLHHVDDGIKLCSPFDSVQVNNVLNFKSVVPAFGNRVV